MLWIFENVEVSDPHSAPMIEDTDEHLHALLDNPDVFKSKDDVVRHAPALCGAQYFDVVKSRKKDGIDVVRCLVLDVDSPSGTEHRVPNEQELRAALEGYRAIVYTSPRHTEEAPRWRVLLPLSTGLPPKKHRALVELLSQHLVPGFPGCINVDSTGDPGRLGFVAATLHPEHYKWWSQKGDRLNWMQLDLEDESWGLSSTDKIIQPIVRGPLWSDRTTALKSALHEYRSTGIGIKRGEGRTHLLWTTAMHLWWAWAAEDEAFVITVLKKVNENFSEPEPEDELARKSAEAYERTVGEKRTEQMSGPYGSRREPSNAISLTSLEAFSKRLKRSKNIQQVTLGEAIRRIVKGWTVSEEPGLWRGLTTNVAYRLAEHYATSETADRIVEYMRPSLAAMRANKDLRDLVPLEDELLSTIRNKIDFTKRAREESRARFDEKARQNISSLTANERDQPYTEREIEAWSGPDGVGLRENTWILVSGIHTYFFVNGTWSRGLINHEAQTDYLKYFDIAKKFVKASYLDERGDAKEIPLDLLKRQYGSVCNVAHDLSVERSWFDVEKNTLVCTGPKRRTLSAVFHPDVDLWLRSATGRSLSFHESVREKEAANSMWRPGTRGGGQDDYDSICDWMACLTELQYPCAALYIAGPRNVGKNLFGSGVARLWEKEYCKIQSAFDQFNARLLESPMVWVNEGIQDAKYKASIVLRDAISAREHTVTKKKIDSGVVLGCIRVLLTANNLNIFSRNNESLTKEDVDALADRFVHVWFRPEAEGYLESIGPERREEMVIGNSIAEHALWLHEKRFATILARNMRFLVEGKNRTVSDVLATDNPVTSECCSVICEAVHDRQKVDWYVVKNNKLLVSADLFRKTLQFARPHLRVSSMDVSKAIGVVTNNIKKVRHRGKQMKMREIRLEALKAWCENSGMFDWEDFEESMRSVNQRAYERDGELIDEEAIQ